MNGYYGSDEDGIESVAWVEVPSLGKAIAIAGFTRSFSDDDTNQAWVALVDPGGDFLQLGDLPWSNVYGSQTVFRALVPVIDELGELRSLVAAGERFGPWLVELDPTTGEPSWQCDYDELFFSPVTNDAAFIGNDQFVFAGAIGFDTDSALFVAKTLRTPNEPCGVEWVRAFDKEEGAPDEILAVTVTDEGDIVVAGEVGVLNELLDIVSYGAILDLDEHGAKKWFAQVAPAGYSTGNPGIRFNDIIEVPDQAEEPDLTHPLKKSHDRSLS